MRTHAPIGQLNLSHCLVLSMKSLGSSLLRELLQANSSMVLSCLQPAPNCCPSFLAIHWQTSAASSLHQAEWELSSSVRRWYRVHCWPSTVNHNQSSLWWWPHPSRLHSAFPPSIAPLVCISDRKCVRNLWVCAECVFLDRNSLYNGHRASFELIFLIFWIIYEFE